MSNRRMPVLTPSFPVRLPSSCCAPQPDAAKQHAAMMQMETVFLTDRCIVWPPQDVTGKIGEGETGIRLSHVRFGHVPPSRSTSIILAYVYQAQMYPSSLLVPSIFSIIRTQKHLNKHATIKFNLLD